MPGSPPAGRRARGATAHSVSGVPPTDGHHQGGLSGPLVALMAVATGAVVANLYYAQPVLHEISATFHSSTTATAAVITCTQVGYAAGLLLVVPLGDRQPRRGLTVRIYLVAAVALVVCALAPSLWLFAAGSVAVGCASVAGQVMIPFAADLAPAERRGRVVARIMTGLLAGILLARTLSGLLAQVSGWRTIFWVSAGLMVVLAAVLRRALPGEAARPALPYRSLVAGSVRLLAEEPVLRRRCFQGAVMFAGFSILWTSLAFLLAGPPYHYDNAVIGLFGLAGLFGVAAANVAGKLADSSRVTATTVASGALLTASFGILVAGTTSVVAVLAGIVVLDIATQGMQITNQAVIYGLRPEARSRINSAYMTCYFVGGALGSVAAGVALGVGGWHGTCLAGAVCGGLSLLASAYDRLRPARAPRPAPADGTAATGGAPGEAVRG